MQFNSSLNRQVSIFSINTSNKRTKGARALAVRDSYVSRWCLRASKGLGRKRKKVVENNYLLKFHLGATLYILQEYRRSFTLYKGTQHKENVTIMMQMYASARVAGYAMILAHHVAMIRARPN